MQRHLQLPVPQGARGAAVAMGNFDGVHRGHQSVIALAAENAQGAPLGIVTFEPHPRSFFAADAPPFRLMNPEARATRLSKLGVEHVFEVPFNADLASLTPRAFCEEILVAGLGISHVVVGADFCFGKGRTGTVETLREEGARFGFGVTIAPLITAAEGAVSSSAIRKALSEGQPQTARDMLGHWHRIEGVVQHGFKRGREMGFPTANIPMEGLHLPAFGVYAVSVDVLDGPHAGAYQGCASLGSRPTFGDHAPNLEIFLLDFEGDLYGATLSTALVAFQRPELKFNGMDALIAQMESDVEEARTLLASHL
ncbi:MAG: bifunctional riboflavin kinase/FAD synthetase [Pseudomonadota bacterium]